MRRIKSDRDLIAELKNIFEKAEKPLSIREICKRLRCSWKRAKFLVDYLMGKKQYLLIQTSQRKYALTNKLSIEEIGLTLISQMKRELLELPGMVKLCNMWRQEAAEKNIPIHQWLRDSGYPLEDAFGLEKFCQGILKFNNLILNAEETLIRDPMLQRIYPSGSIIKELEQFEQILKSSKNRTKKEKAFLDVRLLSRDIADLGRVAFELKEQR